MEEKIHCINVPLTLDRILNIMNEATSDKDARTKAASLLFNLRDRLFQTPSRGLLALELPKTEGGNGKDQVMEAQVVEPTTPKEELN